MELKEYTHFVNYYETDRMGVTHHSNYIRWMEEARIDFLKQIGWDYAKLEEEGIICPVTAVSCKYRHSTTFNDTVAISVTIEDFSGIRLKLKYTMKDSTGKKICEGSSEHCFINSEGKVLLVKKEYPDFYKDLSALIEQKQK